MNTLKNTGNRIIYTNAGSAILAGAVVVLVSGASGFLGIAVTDIPASTAADPTGQVCVGGPPEGVHTLAKKVGDAFTAFQQVYWDAGNSRLTVSSTGNTLAGRVDAAYASSATTAGLLLNRR